MLVRIINLETMDDKVYFINNKNNEYKGINLTKKDRENIYIPSNLNSKKLLLIVEDNIYLLLKLYNDATIKQLYNVIKISNEEAFKIYYSNLNKNNLNIEKLLYNDEIIYFKKQLIFVIKEYLKMYNNKSVEKKYIFNVINNIIYYLLADKHNNKKYDIIKNGNIQNIINNIKLKYNQDKLYYYIKLECSNLFDDTVNSYIYSVLNNKQKMVSMFINKLLNEYYMENKHNNIDKIKKLT